MATESIEARRVALPQAKNAQNAGLVLRRWLAKHDQKEEKKESVRALIQQVVSIGAPEAYTLAYRRWHTVATQNPNALVMRVETGGPLAVGLGSATPLENGLSFLDPYGVPVLPGSALKGLCRRGVTTAVAQGRVSQEQLDALFGTGGDSDAADGIVVFYDAWYVPQSVEGKPLQADTITNHHQAYYAGGQEAPTDFDEPNPVAFLSVRAGAQFLVCIEFIPEACALGWPRYVEQLLKWSLDRQGLGGKTNAGYGSLQVTEVIRTPDARGQAHPQAPSATPYLRPVGNAHAQVTATVPESVTARIETIRSASDLGRCDLIFTEIESLTPAVKKQVATQLQARLARLKLWTPKNAEKRWYQKIQELRNGD